jgi:hypothetical protein
VVNRFLSSLDFPGRHLPRVCSRAAGLGHHAPSGLDGASIRRCRRGIAGGDTVVSAQIPIDTSREGVVVTQYGRTTAEYRFALPRKQPKESVQYLTHNEYCN